ncbi:MAG TPA: OmpA family protein [Thermoanaerobaculia bacterium]|nr:OmpA family protein [Thermoanaerobaculia bacterium]
MLRRKASVILLITIFAVACATTDDDPNKKAKRGAAIGAAAGAIAGAIIGNQGGNNRAGAVVGAVAGAAIGGAVGHRMDKQEQELREIPGVEVSRPSEGEIDVRLTSDILFDTDSSGLRSESRATLRGLAENFQRYPENYIDVEGHTDSTGSDDYNLALSERRADAVRDYLVNQGLEPSHVSARGFGESQPKEPNDTPDGRQLNRRVEIHIRAGQT